MFFFPQLGLVPFHVLRDHVIQTGLCSSKLPFGKESIGQCCKVYLIFLAVLTMPVPPPEKPLSTNIPKCPSIWPSEACPQAKGKNSKQQWNCRPEHMFRQSKINFWELVTISVNGSSCSYLWGIQGRNVEALSHLPWELLILTGWVGSPPKDWTRDPRKGKATETREISALHRPLSPKQCIFFLSQAGD